MIFTYQTYSQQEEYNVPISECTQPLVMLTKYRNMNFDEKKAYNDSVVAAIVELEKKRAREIKAKRAKEGTEDYSKSFSGTAEDTKAEREAAAVMRGSDGAASAEQDNPLLRRPVITYAFEERALRKGGVWKKYMGAECFMYIHTLLRDIVSVRPEDYEDEGTCDP
jgi:hypothetical protein